MIEVLRLCVMKCHKIIWMGANLNRGENTEQISIKIWSKLWNRCLWKEIFCSTHQSRTESKYFSSLNKKKYFITRKQWKVFISLSGAQFVMQRSQNTQGSGASGRVLAQGLRTLCRGILLWKLALHLHQILGETEKGTTRLGGTDCLYWQ